MFRTTSPEARPLRARAGRDLAGATLRQSSFGMRFGWASAMVLACCVAACGDDGRRLDPGPSGEGGIDAPLSTGSGDDSASDGSGGSGPGPGGGGSSYVSSSGVVSSSAGGIAPTSPVYLLGDQTGTELLDIGLLASGDYVVTGWGDAGHGVLARLTPDGEIVWALHVGPGDISYLSDLVVLEDDSVVVGGYVRIETDRAVVARVAPDGEVLWQRQAPTGLGLDDDVGAMALRGDVIDVTVGNGAFVTITPDGTYVSGAALGVDPFAANARSLPGVAGSWLEGSVYVDEEHNTRKAWVARLDDEGAITWQRDRKSVV